MSDELRLIIELVPSTSWYSNVRSLVSKERWDKLRNFVYARFDNRCAICKNIGKLHCHEKWIYDDVNHVQELSGFVALCEMCHHIKHVGLAGIMASRGQLDYEDLIIHFMKVNNCSRDIFFEHRKKAFVIWEERSKYMWKIDLNGLKH